MIVRTLEPGHYETVTLGGWRATLVRVGVMAIGAPTLLGPDAGPGTVDIAANVLLLEGHGRTILVDAGGGPVAGWHAGRSCDLGEAVARAGTSLDAVDAVLLTHLDFDHVGGVVTGSWPDALVPRLGAPVHAAQAALDDALSADPDAHRNAATRIAGLLGERGLLRAFVAGDEPAPGLLLRDAPGHRTGHVALEIGGGGAPLLFLSDAVHHPEHVARPELDGEWDADRAVALETRRRLLAEAEERGLIVGGSHLETFGRVAGGAWEPLGLR